LLVKGGLEIHDVPGDHLSMLQEPNISVLAERLKACIQQSAAKTITSDIKSGF
jgi:aspartate racemase